MGTNYYLVLSGNLLDRLAGREEEVLHIGKSSGGWCFGLQYLPELGLKSLADWYKLFVRDNNRILDEYDRDVTVEDMIKCITRGGWKPPTPEQRARSNLKTCPKGFLRHPLDGNICVAHGSGSWDMISGEFT